MKSTAACPPAATLSAWLDGEPDTIASEKTLSHVRECPACREQVAAWVDAARVLPRHPLRNGAALQTCLDEESLVAYFDAQLNTEETRRAEQHLAECTHCVAEVQRLMTVRVAMEEAVEETTASPLLTTSAQPRREVRRRGFALQDLIRSLGNALARPWPAMGMLAATALVVVVVARLLPSGSSDEIRMRSIAGNVQVVVTADAVVAQARPGGEQATVVTLERGTVASRLEEADEWTRIQLADGRRVWVRSAQVARIDATP